MVYGFMPYNPGSTGTWVRVPSIQNNKMTGVIHLMATRKDHVFVVTLCGRKEEPCQTVEISGKVMLVNHRGDLLITEAGGYDPKLICCYRTGSWIKAERKDVTDG